MIRILYDSFFHMPPGHRIGRDIAVGGYRMNFGRYTPGDCYHPNGLAFLEAELADEYEIRFLRGPYTAASLFEADILFVPNPDYPLYEGASPWRWEPEDVRALLEFCERGGGVILLINSFLSHSDFWEENFDIERVSLLLDQLGVRWDPNYMSDDKFIEKAQAGSYPVGYGQGGRLLGGNLPGNLKPLITYNNQIYGFSAEIGMGKLAVIGDAGLVSNGLVNFPGFDNLAFIRDLFGKVAPAWCRSGMKKWDYRSYAHLSSAPSKDGLNENIFRSLRPAANWQVDHHYRHLTWDREKLMDVDRKVWQKLPVQFDRIRKSDEAEITLEGICLDTDKSGKPFPMKLVVRESAMPSGKEIQAIGRTTLTGLSWKDLSDNQELFRPAGEIENVGVVFDMRVLLDDENQPARAHWKQGQFLYARNARAGHYGYEIVLASNSGVIVPRA